MLTAPKESRMAVGIGGVSRMFDVSKDSIKRHIKAGELRVIHIGNRVLVPWSECERVAREGLGKDRKTKVAASSYETNDIGKNKD